MPGKRTGAWNFATRWITGAGGIGELPDTCKAHGIAKPLVVTDRGLAASSLVADIMARLKAAGLTAGLFSEIKPNPNEGNPKDGVAAYKACGQAGVVAVGGGWAVSRRWGSVLPEGGDMEKDVADIERSLVLAALAQSNGVQTRAAEVLKISYRSFRHLAKKYEL